MYIECWRCARSTTRHWSYRDKSSTDLYWGTEGGGFRAGERVGKSFVRGSGSLSSPLAYKQLGLVGKG